MSDMFEKLAKSLTADSAELIDFLPYLLQDLWELGSSPDDMVDLIKENLTNTDNLKMLDIACGKGAVSVYMARCLNACVKGIDYFKEFIDFAKIKAREYGVSDLCVFEQGDANRAVLEEFGHDVVIFGAAGDILGTPSQLVGKLKRTVKKEGYILIDDGYVREDSDFDYLTKVMWLDVFKEHGVELVDEKLVSDIDIHKINEEQVMFIEKRAEELSFKYPDKSELFSSYVKSQKQECTQLENDIVGVTMLLRVK